MGRRLKCPHCGTYNEKEETVFYNQRYYCKVCFDEVKKESEDYKSLISYICELYNTDVPNGWILKQIKEYKEQFNYTYRGMKTTLDYFYRIKQEDEPEDGMGIGIIPFMYDEAKKFYADKINVKRSVEESNIEDIKNNKRIIHVKEKDKPHSNQYRDVVTIDISQL